MGQPLQGGVGASTSPTIGTWTITTLTKVIQDIFTRNPPRQLPILDCDSLTVHNTLLVEKDVTFLGQDFRAVGTTGNPAFQNSWTNFGNPEAAASFVRAPDGWVRLHGTVKVATNPLTLPSVIFQLPPGYRPEATCLFATISNNLLARVEVDSAGIVSAIAPTSNAAPWVSLETLTFKAV